MAHRQPAGTPCVQACPDSLAEKKRATGESPPACGAKYSCRPCDAAQTADQPALRPQYLHDPPLPLAWLEQPEVSHPTMPQFLHLQTRLLPHFPQFAIVHTSFRPQSAETEQIFKTARCSIPLYHDGDDAGAVELAIVRISPPASPTPAREFKHPQNSTWRDGTVLTGCLLNCRSQPDARGGVADPRDYRAWLQAATHAQRPSGRPLTSTVGSPPIIRTRTLRFSPGDPKCS